MPQFNLSTMTKDFVLWFKNLPKSVKFWNAVALASLIVTAFIGSDILGSALLIGSVIVFAMTLDGILDTEKHLWAFFMPITWLILIIAAIVVLGIFVYSKTIGKFNDWLDDTEQ